jgi:hypothetical protein
MAWDFDDEEVDRSGEHADDNGEYCDCESQECGKDGSCPECGSDDSDLVCGDHGCRCKKCNATFCCP